MKLIGMNILKPLALASLAGLAAASSEELPHDHQGKLSKYELGPPKIFLSGDDLAQLREGRPVMQAAQQAGSSARRMVMVQDIKTPHDVVMGCAALRSCAPISRTSAMSCGRFLRKIAASAVKAARKRGCPLSLIHI